LIIDFLARCQGIESAGGEKGEKSKIKPATEGWVSIIDLKWPDWIPVSHSLQDVILLTDNINRHSLNLVQRLLAFDPASPSEKHSTIHISHSSYPRKYDSVPCRILHRRCWSRMDKASLTIHCITLTVIYSPYRSMLLHPGNTSMMAMYSSINSQLQWCPSPMLQ